MQPLAIFAAQLIAALAGGIVFQRIAWFVLGRLSARADSHVGASIVHHCRKASVTFFACLALYVCLESVPAPEAVNEETLSIFKNGLVALLTFALAWMLIRLTSVAEDVIARRFDILQSDNLQARTIYTQFSVLRKIVVVVIGVVAVGLVLMGYESFRHFGTGILASAGLVGLVVGLAAQQTLGNLLAGIQLAITQPIRIDDVVIVEGEWGRIEEITLTYVVVRIWDLRRLVLPIRYFLEKPFQNWTRVSADILGTVFLYVDYTIPVDVIRSELNRIVKGSPLWDRKVCGVQVTNTSPEGVEVRVLISATDAGKAWDLRCEVREKLVAFLQQRYPESLPKVRGELRNVT